MSDSGLAQLNLILDREIRNRALERRALRLGARSKQREYIEERNAQLAAAAERRRRLASALSSAELDALRFRFYFESLSHLLPEWLQGITLNEIRRWIDSEIRVKGEQG